MLAACWLLAVEEPVEKAALRVVFLGLFLVGAFGLAVLGPVAAALLLLLPAPFAQFFERILLVDTAAADQLEAGLSDVLVAKIALGDVGGSGTGDGQACSEDTGEGQGKEGLVHGGSFSIGGRSRLRPLTKI